MTKRVLGLAMGLVAALGLTGCTTPDDRTPPSSSPSTTERPPAPRPKDRDEEAVLSALRRIDLCAVLDKALAATPGAPADANPEAPQPSRCDLAGMRYPISATVVGLVHSTRLSLQARAIGGAKGYVRYGSSSCAVFLPVSFEKAIEFSQVPHGTPSDEACRTVVDVAAASAGVLADPDTVQVAPRWNACDALTDALGSEAEKTKLLGDGLDDCADFTHVPSPLSISFANELVPTGDPRDVTIGGKQARVYEFDDGVCDIDWRQGPFNSRYAAEPEYPVRLISLDCDRGKTVAESLVRVLGEAPPDDVAPQRPLLYAPDEPDSPYPGACAYVDGSDLNRCEPYVETRVPDQPGELAKVGVTDGQVGCAAAMDAVGRQFGAGLRPVAIMGSCYFVEPERRIQVLFAINPGRTIGDTDSTKVTVAGHPGYAKSSASYVDYRLSTTTTLEGDATLELRVTTGPVVPKDGSLPAGNDKKAESVLTDILGAHFS